jgi:hypothetical protein
MHAGRSVHILAEITGPLELILKQPCDLTDIRLADGKRYSCPEKCHIARWVDEKCILLNAACLTRWTATSSMTNTVVTLAFALSPASFASDSVRILITCMACNLERLIFAGQSPKYMNELW